MLRSMSALVAFAITATLSQYSAVAQAQMTNLPWRIEEALINPDLGAVLRDSHAKQNLRPTSPTRDYPARNRPSALAQRQPLGNSTSNNHYRSPTSASATPRVADRSNDAAFSVRSKSDIENKPKGTDQPAASPNNNADSKSNETPAQSTLSKEQLSQLEKLQVQVTGATAMVASEAANLTVEVTNPTDTKLGPVDVNLQVPDAITITRFDRDAWLDDERRIVAFRLDEVAPGQTQTIRLKGISHSPGKTSLRVILTSGVQMIAGKKFDSQVFPQQLAKKYTFGDTEPETNRK